MAGAPSPFSRSGRPCYWLRGQLKGTPPLSAIQRTAAACGDGRGKLPRGEARGVVDDVYMRVCLHLHVHICVHVCMCVYAYVCRVRARVRESEWKWRRWKAKKGKQHFLWESGLAVIFGHYNFHGDLQKCANKFKYLSKLKKIFC